MKKNLILFFISFLSMTLVSFAFVNVNLSNDKALNYAKVKEFKLIHSVTEIKTDARSNYADLNKLTDDQLKKTVTSPSGGDYVTVKSGTKDLRDGNTRIYILLQRGFGELSIPYDEVDTSFHYDF